MDARGYLFAVACVAALIGLIGSCSFALKEQSEAFSAECMAAGIRLGREARVQYGGRDRGSVCMLRAADGIGWVER